MAGIGIRSSLQAGLSGFGSGGMPQELFRGAITGLTQGTLSVGLNYLIDEMDLNPLLANGGLTLIAGAIEGAFSQGDMFKGIKNSFLNAVLSPFKVGTSPWEQAIYISQILDFSDLIRQHGFVETLDTYAQGIFNASAVNGMITAAGSVANYLNQLRANNEYNEYMNGDGKIERTYYIREGDTVLDSFSTVFDDDIERLYKIGFGDSVKEGWFGIDSFGAFGLKEGYSYYNLDEEGYALQYYNPNQGYSLKLVRNGNPFLEIESATPIFYDDAFNNDRDLLVSTPAVSYRLFKETGGNVSFDMKQDGLSFNPTNLFNGTEPIGEMFNNDIFDGTMDVDAWNIIKEYVPPQFLIIGAVVAAADPLPIEEIAAAVIGAGIIWYASEPRLRQADYWDLGPLKGAVGLSGSAMPDPDDEDEFWKKWWKKDDDYYTLNKWGKFIWYAKRVCLSIPRILNELTGI